MAPSVVGPRSGGRIIALALLVAVVLGAVVAVITVFARGRTLGVAAGVLVAGAVVAVAGIVLGNRADEMSGIGYLVAGGAAFWFVVVPAAVVMVLQLRRS